MLSKPHSSGKHGFESHRKGKERSKHNLRLLDIYCSFRLSGSQAYKTIKDSLKLHIHHLRNSQEYAILTTLYSFIYMYVIYVGETYLPTKRSHDRPN